MQKLFVHFNCLVQRWWFAWFFYVGFFRLGARLGLVRNFRLGPIFRCTYSPEFSRSKSLQKSSTTQKSTTTSIFFQPSRIFTSLHFKNFFDVRVRHCLDVGAPDLQFLTNQRNLDLRWNFRLLLQNSGAICARQSKKSDFSCLKSNFKSIF